MDDTFRTMLMAACERPGMYVGRESLWDLSHYLNGYWHCAFDFGSPVDFGERFQRWVEARYAIYNSGWNWVRILLHEFGNHRSAIATLPEIYDAFRRETRDMTDEDIRNMTATRLLDVRGSECWCPEDDETWTSPHSMS